MCDCDSDSFKIGSVILKTYKLFSLYNIVNKEIISTGVIEGDTISDTQEMGDPDKEVTDEERDQSDEKRSEAMRAFSEQKYDEALQLYTEAIKLNPQSALLFAKRGQVNYVNF